MSDTTVNVEDPSVIEIELGDDETGLAGGVEAPKKPEPAPAPVSAKITPATTPAAEEAAASLNEQIRRANADRDAAIATAAAERRGRETAEQARQRAMAQAEEAQAEATNSKLSVITSGIEAAEREVASGKTAYKNAHESGDADAMADAQIRMGRATAKLDRLMADKEQFDAEAARRKDGGGTRTAVPEGGIDRESWLLRFPPKPQAWLRSHPECLPPQYGGDPERHQAMMDAHTRALQSNIPEGSDSYYNAVEETLGYRSPTSAAATTTAAGAAAAAAVTAARAEPTPAAHKPRPIPQPSAPPSSATPSAAPGGPARSQTVKLNAAEQEIAKLSYPQKKDEADDAWLKRAYGTYGKYKIEAIADGTIGRRSH